MVELVRVGNGDWDFPSLDVNILVCGLEGIQKFEAGESIFSYKLILHGARSMLQCIDILRYYAALMPGRD